MINTKQTKTELIEDLRKKYSQCHNIYSQYDWLQAHKHIIQANDIDEWLITCDDSHYEYVKRKGNINAFNN